MRDVGSGGSEGEGGTVTETSWYTTLENAFLCVDISWYNLKTRRNRNMLVKVATLIET